MEQLKPAEPIIRNGFSTTSVRLQGGNVVKTETRDFLPATRMQVLSQVAQAVVSLNSALKAAHQNELAVEITLYRIGKDSVQEISLAEGNADGGTVRRAFHAEFGDSLTRRPEGSRTP